MSTILAVKTASLAPAPRRYQNQDVSQTRTRGGRAEPRDILELRQLKQAHPELATAVDMQIALVGLQRRIQSRLTTPLLTLDDPDAVRRLSNGRRLVDFDDLSLDWSEFRLTFRQTAEILHRFGTIESSDHDALQALVRDGTRVEPLTREYYARTSGPGAEAGTAVSAMLDTVLALALRPFLTRCSDVWLARLDLAAWLRAWCPICGGEPDFATLNASGGRSLICNRCLAQWPFHALACPFCGNDSERGVRSFASRDRRYRVFGCERCRKYLKAYDARGAERPVMPSVDTIATLPLDAAAIQNGYDG